MSPQTLPIPPSKHSNEGILSHHQEFLIPFVYCLIFGVLLGFWTHHQSIYDIEIFTIPYILCLSTILLGLILWTQTSWVIRVSFLLLALLWGGCLYQYRSFSPSSGDVSQLGTLQHVQFTGVIEERELDKGRFIFRFQTYQLGNDSPQAITGKGLVLSKSRETVSKIKALERGALISFEGSLNPPEENILPGAFNLKQYLWGRGLTVEVKQVNNLQILNPHPSLWEDQWANQLELARDSIADTFKKGLPSPQAEVLGGIVLGDHAIPVESALKQAFIQTGLIHLLAASGFNVGIVAGFILWLGQLIFTRGPFKNPMARVMGLTGSSWQIILAMISVACYCLLTGLPPSIQRSGMMLELALILKLFDKALSPVLLLGVAVSLILMASPDVIGNIGFQFSVLTTFGLITMVSPLQEWLGYYITRWLSGILLIPIIAQLWITPLSVYYFNQLPLHSVLLNCLSLVFITPLTLIGFVSALLSFIWSPLGEWGAWCAQPFLNGMLFLVHWGADMEWAQMCPESPEIWIIVGCYLLLLISSASFYLYPEAPTPRRVLGVVLPSFIFCLALFGQKVIFNKNTSLQAVPVSYHQLAWVARPRGSNQFLLLLPESLSFWESRTLKDYIKHLNPQRLAGIIVLPSADETVKIKYPVGESYFLKFLAKSFPHQLISVYSPNSLDVFSGHPPHSEYQSHFKTVGLKLGQTLQYGTLAFQWTNSNEFQLNTPTYCLTNQDKSSHCRLQYQQPPSGPYRLRFKQPSKDTSQEKTQERSYILNNNQFYALESDGEKLTIY